MENNKSLAEVISSQTSLTKETINEVADVILAEFESGKIDQLEFLGKMEFMAQVGGVPQADMERTWNCGIGMVAIVDSGSASLAIKSLAARGMKAWACGEVRKIGEHGIRSELVGKYGS